MPDLRSRVTTHGRNASGARSLWRATGMTDDDFGKPIVAIANSYTQFVPQLVEDSAFLCPPGPLVPGRDVLVTALRWLIVSPMRSGPTEHSEPEPVGAPYARIPG